MDLEAIIGDADTLIPSNYEDADKVIWLNEINHDFFEKVKIPLTVNFTTVKDQAAYSLNSNVRAKNIDYVKVGTSLYLNFFFENVSPGTNYHTFDEDTEKITLDPAPARSGVSGTVRYFKIATTTFVTANLDQQSPDAPTEYHWIYTLGLCQKIAEAMDDIAKATNYGNRYNAAIAVAQQNYGQGA